MTNATGYDAKPSRTRLPSGTLPDLKAAAVREAGRLVPAKPFAKRLGVPYTTLRDLVFKGRLSVIRIGRAWYFDSREEDKFVERSRETLT